MPGTPYDSRIDRWNESRSPFENVDRGWWILPSRVVSAKPLPSFSCNRCQATFSSEEGLFYHMRTRHNTTPPSFRVNEKVVDGDLMLEKVESICIYPNGHSGVVQLEIDGRKKNISFDGKKNRIDLLESNDAINASKFKLSFNGKEILIEQREVKEIKNPKVFEYIDAMRNSLGKGERIDWSVFVLNPLDDVEQRFYEGFYDYY